MSSRAHTLSGTLSLGGRLLTRQRLKASLWSPAQGTSSKETELKTDSKGRFRYRSKELGKGERVQRLRLRFAPGADASSERVGFIHLPAKWSKATLDVGEFAMPLKPLLVAGVVLNAGGEPMRRAALNVVSADSGSPVTTTQFDEYTTDETGFFCVYGELPSSARPRLSIFHFDFDQLIQWNFKPLEEQLIVTLEHGVEVLVTLLLDEAIPQSMLMLEMIPEALARGAAVEGPSSNGVSATRISRVRKATPHRFGPFSPGSYLLRARQRMELQRGQQYLMQDQKLSIRVEGFGGLKLPAPVPTLFEMAIQVPELGDQRELALDPIDLRDELSMVRLRCVDPKGQPIQTAELTALGLDARLPASTVLSELEEKYGDLYLPNETGPEVAKLGLGQDGEIRIIVNPRVAATYMLAAESFVDVKLEALVASQTIKMKPQLQVMVHVPELGQAPPGVDIEGALVPRPEESESGAEELRRLANATRFRPLDAAGSFQFGVDAPGAYVLRLRIQGKSEEGTFRVILPGPGRSQAPERFQIEDLGDDEMVELSSLQDSAQLKVALKKLEEILWQ